MLESLMSGLLRGSYLIPVVVGCLLAARHGAYLPLWLPQCGLVSAYTAYYLAERLEVPVLGAILLALLAGAAFGLIAHRLVFQRCVDGAEPYRALVCALAMIVLVTNAVGLLTSGYPVSFSRARGSWQVFVRGPVSDTIRAPDIAALLGAIAILVGVAWFVGRTRLGLEYRAASSNRDLARAYGHRVKLLDIVIPLVSALLCSFGGLVYALKFGAQPSFMVPVSIKAIAVVVALAAAGGVVLAGLAALVLAVGESLVQASPSLSAFEQGVAYVVLVAAILVQYVAVPRANNWLWRRRLARAGA